MPPERDPAHLEDDQLEVVAREIARLLRTASEATDRLAASAEREAAERVAAAQAQADGLLALARERIQAFVAAAKSQLEEASALLRQAQEHDRVVRHDADEYARDARADLARLQLEAADDREQARLRLARSVGLLTDAEAELASNLDHTANSLAALSTIHEAMNLLQGEGAVEGAPSAGLIDLTTSSTDAPSEAPSAEADKGQLDQTLRDAVSRAIEQAARELDPPDGPA